MIGNRPARGTRTTGSDTLRMGRSAFAEYVTEEIEKSGVRVIAMLMVNLSRPKHYEPITRASAWEAKLEQIETRLEGFLRERDRYAYLSDEKLCVVLPGLASKALSVLAAVRILSALDNPLETGTRGLLMQACVGISVYPDHASDADHLVACADIAASIAATGEDGYRMYVPETDADSDIWDGQIEASLLEAIRTNELPVHYQPQIEISSGRMVAAEALLRWKAPGSAEMTITALVRAAERAGLIAPLTFAVISTVLRHAGNLSAKGLDIILSVNLSAIMLRDTELPDIVREAIDTWDVPASRLTFEITESSMIGDMERSLRLLTRLRDIGVRLSIDDFGTGYSSLAYLKRLPVNELKIDKLFVGNMLKERGDRQIVRSVIDLSHNFGLQAVAEGVEDQPTFNELKAMGCDIAQGFLFSPAISYSAFLHWWKSSKT